MPNPLNQRRAPGGRVSRIALAVVLVLSYWTHESSTAAAEEQPGEPYVENERFSLRLILRTAEQIAAFYEARGFPKEALDSLTPACFITAIMLNKSDEVIWLELDNWRFSTTTGEIKRLNRTAWFAEWDRIGLSQANRSTFGWTLLPEVRDLRPAESVGGNVVIAGGEQLFTLEARFATRGDKRGDELVARFENLRCPGQETSR